ncbi:hypothetical protein [Microbacterium sp. SORGH_AS_0888]|uniref:hypothetical protein n=1 Tax=Microbacterium sp. SORGH_AS_0888 TaxID=3041791 RepID=UPI002786A9EE|nr:hypothetical protein [Microbacterium sp. SORGH_AS_0888]MDQ1128293.1 hypothetical protein [Microbacterium sp. SORGH_AS_0888]
MSTTLSTIAQRLADEIKAQDWSDAHTRPDGARHDRQVDRKATDTLTAEQTELVRLNVVWVTGQALLEDDPRFDIRAYAEACGVSTSWLLTKRGAPNRGIESGLRPRRSRVVWDD